MSANGHYPATITQIHSRTPSSATILLKLDVAAGELAMRGVEAFNAVRHAKQRGVPVGIGSRVVCTLCRSAGGGGERERVVDRVGGFVVVGGGEGGEGGGVGDVDGVGEGGDGDGEGGDGIGAGNMDGYVDGEGVDGHVEGGDVDGDVDENVDGDGDCGWWWRRWVRRNAVVGWHMRGLV